MQEQERPRARSERTGHDDDLANRLDRLSRADAERVLERAIRIQTQRHSTDSFTPEQIKRIAGELGIDGSVVDRAMREQVAKPPPFRSGMLGPDRLVDRATVAGSPEEVDDVVMGWMEREEGLRAVARVDGGIRWEPDNHWTTATRLAFGSESTKALRGMPAVIHRQTALSPDEQVVEIDVGTDRIRNTALGLGAGFGVAGVGGGIATALAVAGGNDLAQFASVAVPMLAVAGGTAFITARAWAASIRRGISRALHGIAHPELNRRAQRRRRRYGKDRRRSGFQRLVDEVVDAIDDVFD